MEHLSVALLYCVVDEHDTPENINLIRVCPSAAAHLLISLHLAMEQGRAVSWRQWVCAAADRNYEKRMARRNNTANEHSEVK